MTLPLSGPLSMSMINTELGRASTSLISLDSASNGAYATINTCSPYYPLGTNPDKISEWYGYNHLAVCTYSEHSLDVTDQSTQNFIYGDDWSNFSTTYPSFGDGFSIAYWVQMAAKDNPIYHITGLYKAAVTGNILIYATGDTLSIQIEGSSTSSIWSATLNDGGTNSTITGIPSGKEWGAGPTQFTGSTNDNNFSHLAFVYDGTQSPGTDQVRFYWNGQALDISYAGDVVGNVTWSTQNLTVGGSVPSELASGMYIDDYTFYYRNNLPDGEIGEIYNGGAPQDPANYSFSYDNILYLFEDEGNLGLDTNAFYDCTNSPDPPPVQSPEHA